MRARLEKREEKLTRLTFRAPASLHKFLTQAALGGNRSLNREIISRLEASIELDRVLNMNDPDEVLLAITELKLLKEFRVPRSGAK